MSAQRRRVLESDGGITEITDNGVYIEGLNSKFYTVDTWTPTKTANSIVVVSNNIRFRMALTQPSSQMMISGRIADGLENYMTGTTSSATAISDYDGAGNTANILKLIPSTDYAAGYCNNFVFPDGKTKGFLPSLGQLYLAQKKKAAVDAALSACGGTAMATVLYWSSTFYGVHDDDDSRTCWILNWRENLFISGYGRLNMGRYVRPFANFP